MHFIHADHTVYIVKKILYSAENQHQYAEFVVLKHDISFGM